MGSPPPRCPWRIQGDIGHNPAMETQPNMNTGLSDAQPEAGRPNAAPPAGWHKAALAVIFLVALLSQLWRFTDPYGLAYETGFQERIARRHLDPGLSVTRGLSTINNLGPEPVFHPTHPPLLQLVLAGLFAVLGDSEAAARLVPLTCFLLLLLGIWKLTHGYLSPRARLLALAAALLCPLSFYAGRIVNFESPVMACVVWTLVWIESLNLQPSRRAWTGLLAVGAVGTLIDWPYPLFVLCLFLLSFFREDRNPPYKRAVRHLFALSMGLSVLYALYVWGAGAMPTLMHHAKVQTGAYSAESGYQLPPFLISPLWWWSLLLRAGAYGTPVLLGTLAAWLICALRKRRWRAGLSHGCLVLSVFGFTYLALFARASHHHVWCLFYLAPLLSLAFGILAERLRPVAGYALLAGVVAFSVPMNFEFRTKKPLHSTVQYGRVIAAATACLPPEVRHPLAGPLLYVNRVDPLPYYAGCETAFSHMSVEVAAPDKFLIRHRPEFVALTGYAAQSSITVTPQYPPGLFERLDKSYTLVYQEANTEQWESLWSPHLSLMGLIRGPGGMKPEIALIEDTVSVHAGARLEPGPNALSIGLKRIPKPGRRWLHGWVIGPGSPALDPILVTVKNGAGRVLGTLQVIPQPPQPRWQEFWLYIGDLPDYIHFSWDKARLLWGDLRLYSDTLWATDLTQVLAGEIRHRLGPKAYRETLNPGAAGTAILQHPGFGVDSVDLPPLRMGYDQDLLVSYGMNPAVQEKSDGAGFKLYARDHALGKRFLLLDDFLNPVQNPQDGEWKTKRIPMTPYSRHVLTFTFEVSPGPAGNSNSDHALWREARLVPREAE